jgi:hypothetical protein
MQPKTCKEYALQVFPLFLPLKTFTVLSLLFQYYNNY